MKLKPRALVFSDIKEGSLFRCLERQHLSMGAPLIKSDPKYNMGNNSVSLIDGDAYYFTGTERVEVLG